MTITNTFKPTPADQAIAAVKEDDTERAAKAAAAATNGKGCKASPRMSKKERQAMMMKAADAAEKANAKKPHEAEIAELALVAKAKSFIATVFVGSGNYAKRERTTLAEARAEGLKLAGIHGKKAMIYAQLPEGLPYKQVLVPDTFWPQETPAAAAGSKEDVAMPKKAAAANGKKAAKAAAPQPPAAKQQQRRGGLGRRGWAEAEEAAKHGKMPPCPDFSAPTHNSYRKKLEIVDAMAKDRDLNGLQKFDLPRKDSSRTAIMRYRDICITALGAQGKAKPPKQGNAEL
jgi:hypothetical protein